MENNKRIAITIGDVGGIGPEIIVKAFNSPEISEIRNNFVIIGNKKLLCDTAVESGLLFPADVEIIDIPLDNSKIILGRPTIEAGKHSFLSIKRACDMAINGEISAIVTAPVSKEALNKAGYHYTGQTEILEEFLGQKNNSDIPHHNHLEKLKIKKLSRFFRNKINKIVPKIVKKDNRAEMLFVADNLRVMLLTRHIKLDSVASTLSIKGIISSILALNNSLIKNFNLENPKIAICGLNPHSGENGLLGHEEDYLIKPALNRLKNKYGLQIEGPFPADALWAKVAQAYMKGDDLPYDAYVVCYHDQGLIPVKMLAMEKAVNTTINLPVIRTSPSHGTAYDIAGKNQASCQSMIAAINLANKTFA